MAKGLNKIQVGLTFTADTGNAKAQLKDLKRQIDNLQSATITGTSITPLNRELTEALNASSRLKVALEQATNVDTGRLDLSKFSLQLKQSGMTMKDFSKHLTNLGPDGEKAFLQLAQSIVTAEVPMKRANAALEEMWTTMKNTARWQISSSILHGFMGAVQSAYGYAQDLNESLNDIRIVTGYNTDQMAKFAKEANKAAKALSTTTTQYTNASLIYFQQGLNDQQVKERTDITVKMANVSKQSAETVSDQMTAVWNNFYDGSKSLEYYADVMTKLGAATASSTDEIATGLEKFAAIADTVGLSYEYATAALATVTSETRQSADVVGTAFKTIFARMEGLSLGETLDDGTDLNKYSQALSTVGVNIKTASGEMKEMDQILEELGSRWQTLGQDQKIALAQTVAGVRQYNQLISLMDNWDTFQENLNTAQGSEGALAAQAEIYAESWEAAQDRVTAAAEDIYSKLLNDEFFIDLTNILADIIDGFSKLIDSMGGLPGLLSMIGGIAVRVFKNQIGESIDRMVYNLKVGTGLVKKETDKMRDETLKALTSFGGESGYESKNLEVEFMKQQVTLAYDLKEVSESISKQDQDHIKNLINMNGELQKSVISTMELKEAQEEKIALLKKEYEQRAVRELIDSSDYNDLDFEDEREKKIKEVVGVSTWAENAGRVDADLESITSKEFSLDMLGNIEKKEDGTYSSSIMEEIKELGGTTYGFEEKHITDLENRVSQLASIIYEIKEIDKQLDDTNLDESEVKKLQEDRERLSARGKGVAEYYNIDSSSPLEIKRRKKIAQSFNKKTEGMSDKSKTGVLEITKASAKAIKTQRELDNQQKSLNKSTQNLNRAFKNAAKVTKSFGQQFVKITSDVSGLLMGISSLKGVFDALSDPDLSPLEKAESLFMSLSMALPSIIGGITSLSGGLANLGKVMQTQNAVQATLNQLLKNQGIEDSNIIAKQILKLGVQEEITKENAEQVASDLLRQALNEQENDELDEKLVKSTAMLLLKQKENQEDTKGIGHLLVKIPLKKAEDAVEKQNIVTKKADTAATNADTAATLLLKAATESLTWPITVIIALLALMVIGLIAVVAVAAHFSKQFGENAQATLDQAKANEELIDSNQELANSVRELIDEYQELSATGESTYDTLEKLKEQMPELIESYKELERNLGLDLGLEKLEQAYKAAQATGNWGEVEVQIKRIDAEVLEAERVVYESGAESSGKLMANAGKSGLGNLSDSKSKYNINFGNGGQDDKKAGQVLRDEFVNLGLSDYITSGTSQTTSVDLKMNLSDPTSMVNYYEGLIAVQAKLREQELEESTTYKQISEELSQLSESYLEAKAQAEGFLDTIAETINSAEDQEFKTLLGFSPEEVDTLKEYNANINEMVKTLAEAKGITEAEARAIIEASDAFSQFANAGARIDIMAQDLDVKDGEKNNLDSIKNNLQNIYDGLSEEDKTLFLTLDIANIDPNKLSESINKALAEAREKAIIAEAKLEAKELGFDESAFESYADILQDTNKHLEGNKGKAYKVGLQNARLSKGLVTLTESFKDNVSILAKGNRESYEYAEAIGALKDSFEEMYGYKPSTVFIEGHLEEIQKLANGDLDALQDLQDELAKDYVLNMEVGTAINTDVVGMSTDEVRNELIEMLDSIDTNLEIGEGTTVSDDYLNSLQAMLDQGQITQEQLQTMLRSKGIEMKVTGYKEVPGPETTTYQKITTPLGTYTKTISESQKIKVPIINGDDSNIYGGTGQALTKDNKGFKDSSEIKKDPNKMAQFAKTADKDSVDTSAFEEASGKADTEEKIKEIKEETDYYHELERELAALEHRYNKISIAKERAFGKERLKLIAEERKNWEQQLKNAEESKVEAQRVATETRNKLVNDFGLSYYKDTGELANYQEVYVREQQARIDAYKTGDEEAIKAADARWEEFQALVQRYEQEGIEKVREAEESAIELQNQIYDSYLEAIEYTVEVNLEVNEGDLEYLEYMLSKSEDDAFDAAYTVNEILGKQTQALMDQSEIYNRGIDEIFANHGVTREQAAQMSQEELKALGFTDRELNSLKEYESGLLEVNTQLMENRKAVEDSLMPLYEAYGEEFDKLTAKVEYATNVMNNYKNIIDLLGKKRLGFDDEFLISMSESQLEVSKNGLQIAKERLATAESSKAEAATKLAQAEKALAADTENKTLQNDVAYWKQIYEELETDVMAQTENVMALTETALQAAQDHYTTLTDSILDEFDKGLSAIGDSMEQMMSKYEASEEVDSRYLESYEKMYELNKLSRKLEGDLAKATSLQEQKSLVKLLDEINAKKAEGIEMSEHDLKILQGQVEMEQARLAVEEARDAKTKVIRRRDSEGNWGYIYTANEEAAQDALQNYEDKVYELMDLNDEYLDDLGMKILEARQTMGEEIAALREEDFASQAEYEAAVDAIKEKYTSQINYYTDEMNKALGYNKDIYSQDITNRLHWYGESIEIGKEQLIAMAEIRESDYANQEEYFEALVQATGLTLEQIKELYHQGTLAHIEEISVQIGANEDLQTSFSDTVLAQTTGFTTMDEFNDKLATSTEKMVERMDQAYKDYTEDIQGVIGTYEEFRKTVDEKINGENGVVKSSKKAEESATDLREKTEEEFRLATTAVQNWQKAYSEEMDKVIVKNEKSVEDILATWSKLKEIDYEVPVEDPSEDGGTAGGGDGSRGKDNGVTNVEGKVDPKNADKSGKDPDGPGVNTDFNALDLGTDKEEAKKYFKNTWPNGSPRATNMALENQRWTPVKSSSDKAQGIKMNGAWYVLVTPQWDGAANYGQTWFTPASQIEDGIAKDRAPLYSRTETKTYPWTMEHAFKFDTGGYTGEWGPEGRLALLHQKEIVLNARDTENMLAMTQMVRDIAKQIDLTAVPTNRSIAPTAIASTNEGIEQNITIHAEFPDAVNQHEIEEAFNNLFMRVSQYANRK